MSITHASVKNPGDTGLASEWNADHVISDEDKSKRSVTLIVAASDSIDKTKVDYICDGIADQVEINTAIVALPVNGGRVVLLEGTYNITSSITPGTGTTLQGQGYNTIINATGDIIPIRSTNKDRIIVRDLRITGNPSAEPDKDNLRLENAEDSSVIRVMTERETQMGISLSGCTRCSILQCTVKNATMDGIFIHNTTYSTVSSCYAEGNDYGIRLWNGADDNVVSTCVAIGGTDSICIGNSPPNPGCFRDIILGNNARNGITDGGTNDIVEHNITA